MKDPEILHTKTLTGLVRKFKGEEFRLVNSGIFPERRIDGTMAQWDIEDLDRSVGQFSGRTSTSKPVGGDAVSNKGVEMFKAFFNSRIESDTLLNLRNPGSDELQQLAEDEVARRTQKLARKIDRMKEFCIAGALSDSTVVTVDGKSMTVTTGIPADHKFTGTDWTNQAHKFLLDIDADTQKIADDSGIRPKIVITSQEVITHMMMNETVFEYFNGTPAGQKFIETGEISNFKGMRWIAHDHSHKPIGGSITRYLDKKKIFYHPGPDREVCEMQVGSVAVPSQDLKRTEKKIGRWAWHKVDDDPPAEVIKAVERFFAVVYNPLALGFRTVLP